MDVGADKQGPRPPRGGMAWCNLVDLGMGHDGELNYSMGWDIWDELDEMS